MRAFSVVRTDMALCDLEGWAEVLDVMSDSRADVPPSAVRMVVNSLDSVIKELRDATGTGEPTREGGR